VQQINHNNGTAVIKNRFSRESKSSGFECCAADGDCDVDGAVTMPLAALLAI